MIKDCRDTKAGKTFSTAEKERNTRASRHHHAEIHQANVAESSTSISDYAFVARASSFIPSVSTLAQGGETLFC
ncbi:hypothetical protein K438DRAFT_1824473 [Mycena galopus ATCC 62051]|nr:hypothetical protein K438DRAFT_1824473 [Mycena galopus ATCC 62051]